MQEFKIYTTDGRIHTLYGNDAVEASKAVEHAVTNDWQTVVLTDNNAKLTIFIQHIIMTSFIANTEDYK